MDEINAVHIIMIFYEFRCFIEHFLYFVTEDPIIEMGEAELDLKKQDTVEILVKRQGNVADSTYVGWKTLDGTAANGKNFIGGTGMVHHNHIHVLPPSYMT